MKKVLKNAVKKVLKNALYSMFNSEAVRLVVSLCFFMLLTLANSEMFGGHIRTFWVFEFTVVAGLPMLFYAVWEELTWNYIPE